MELGNESWEAARLARLEEDQSLLRLVMVDLETVKLSQIYLPLVSLSVAKVGEYQVHRSMV